MKRNPLLLGLALMGFLLFSCRATEEFTTIIPQEPTATATPSPTATLTPTPTATPTPLPTPTPEPAARIESGDEALFHGDWDRAIAEFQSAQQFSSDPEIQSAAQLGLGRTYLLSGNTYEAVRILEGLVTAFPDSPHLPDTYFHLARALSANSQFTEAADAYLEYLARRPGVIDGYVLDWRGDALFAAGDYAGAANDFAAALRSPSLRDPNWLEMKLARSYALGGDLQTALGLYDDVYLRADASTRALIDLRKGQAYTALGQFDQAAEAYLDAVYNYPNAYESYSALLALVETGHPVDELSRGLVDYFAGQYGVALAAFDRYLQGNPADPGTAIYYMGLTQRAAGNSQGAVTTWDQVIQGYPDHRFWDDAYEQKAFTQWAYLDQYTLAQETLEEFVRTSPTHSRAAEFLFDAALVAERAGRLDEAAAIWQRVVDEYPASEWVQRASFLQGIAFYRLERYPDALSAFQRNLYVSPGLYERAGALFWMGKAQQANGDETGARATWEQAASTDPTGYYSERARDLLRNRPPFSPPRLLDIAYDPDTERRQAEDWVRTTFALPDDTNLTGLGPLETDLYIQRGTELWRLGMWGEARNEFEQLRQSVSSDAATSYRLACYLADLGVYRSATMAARQVLTLAGMDDAATMTAPTYLNRLRFGTYFTDLIFPMAEKYEFDPLFLFSVVRQESLFESFASSSASARGLMQVIPATGADIARNLGWPTNYTEADLYRPLVSITFGVDYLDTQRKNFDGNLYAALAAYNGGPGNSAEWLRMAPDDPDLFLEVIRYEETRRYIRSIYEIFSIYRRLYDRSP